MDKSWAKSKQDKCKLFKQELLNGDHGVSWSLRDSLVGKCDCCLSLLHITRQDTTPCIFLVVFVNLIQTMGDMGLP